MTRREFLAWWEFYDAHPFDDEARYWRPAALMASATHGWRIGGGKPADHMAWLVPEPAVRHARFSQSDLTTMATFGFKPPR